MKILPLKMEGQEWKVQAGLLHQVVVKELSSRRLGTSKVKTRHEVAGSTRKIYRQKGTGNARHGDIKAPLFVGGGQAFGPKPRDWSYVLPQKARRGGLRSAVALRRQEEKLWMLEGEWQEPKTKLAASFFDASKIGNALLVVDGSEKLTARAVRNLQRFEVRNWNDVSVTDIMKHEHLVVTKTALKPLEGRLS